MKISELIATLENVKKEFGDVQVSLQDDGKSGSGQIIGHESFFVVPEKYDEETICNLRWWPA